MLSGVITKKATRPISIWFLQNLTNKAAYCTGWFTARRKTRGAIVTPAAKVVRKKEAVPKADKNPFIAREMHMIPDRPLIDPLFQSFLS